MKNKKILQIIVIILIICVFGAIFNVFVTIIISIYILLQRGEIKEFLNGNDSYLKK